jgi:hypothetical protein
MRHAKVINNALKLTLVSFLANSISFGQVDCENKSKEKKELVFTNNYFDSNLEKFFNILEKREFRKSLEERFLSSDEEQGGCILMEDNLCMKYVKNGHHSPKEAYLFLTYHQEIQNPSYFTMFHNHPLSFGQIQEPSNDDLDASKNYGPSIVFSVGYSTFRIFGLKHGEILFEKEYKRITPVKLGKNEIKRD